MTVPSAKPHVMMATLSLARGGTEGHICEIAPRLVERGFRISVYCFIERGPLAESLEARGVRVISRTASSNGPAGSKAALKSAPHFWRTLKQERPDIAHFFLPAAYLIGAPIALQQKIPAVIMSRRSLNHYQNGKPTVAALERRLHKRMTVLIGNSRKVVDELLEEGAPPERTHLIYNGVDVEKFARSVDRSAVRQTLGIPQDAFVIICVANLIPYKGHADLIAALGLVAKDLPQPWRLVCVGRDDGIGASLAAQSRSLGLGENVKFLGSRSDVPDLLAAADLGVLASHEEGFSNAILEGMAAGLPMVVTDAGGNAEAVVDGETGFVVPPQNPEVLGQRLLELAVSRDQAQRMSSNAKRRAIEKFSAEACVDGYEKLYAEVTGATK